MINIRGVNVYPASIESVVRRFPEVVEFRSTVSQTGAMRSLSVEIELAPRPATRPALVARVAQRLREALGLTVPVHGRRGRHAAAVRDEGPAVRRGGVACACPSKDRASDPDVVVIGGGPAGSTVSTLLAQQGYQRRAVRARALSALSHRRIADPRDLLGAEAAQHAAEDAAEPLRQEVQRAVRQLQRQASRRRSTSGTTSRTSARRPGRWCAASSIR